MERVLRINEHTINNGIKWSKYIRINKNLIFFLQLSKMDWNGFD